MSTYAQKFYFLVFVVSVAVLVAGLIGYYQLPELESMFGQGSFSALDLGRPINILTWFFSVIWIVMVIQAVMIIALTHENRLGLSQQMFWINVAVICLVMSANSICSFSPLLKNAFESSLVKAGVSDAVRGLVHRFLYLGVTFFLFVELSLLFRYIRRQCQSRTLLRSSFLFCLVVFGVTFFGCWQIPNEAVSPESVLPPAPETSEPDHTDRKSPRARGLIASHSGKNRVKTLKTDEAKPRVVAQADASGSFRYASREEKYTDESTGAADETVVRTSQFKTVADETVYSGDSSEDNHDEVAASDAGGVSPSDSADTHNLDASTQAAVVKPGSGANVSGETASDDISDSSDAKDRPLMKRWEDLFGWQKSLEEQFGFKRDFEEMLGWPGSVESMVLGADVSLDLLRIRTIVRYGLFGFSLITLCIAFGLVARGGRMRINKRYRDQFSQFYEINEGRRLAMRNSF